MAETCSAVRAAGLILVPLLGGCTGGSGGTADPDAAVIHTAEAGPPGVAPGPATTSAPSSSGAGLSVGVNALSVGEWRRETSGVRSRVAEVVQPADAQTLMPQHLHGDPGAEGALARVQYCLGTSGPAIFHQREVVDLFVAYDESGGRHTRAGGSWGHWPPRPQFPEEVSLSPGECATGWIRFSTAAGTEIHTVDGLSGQTIFAEWLVDP